jgi:hypothetical protein
MASAGDSAYRCFVVSLESRISTIAEFACSTSLIVIVTIDV